MAEHDAYNNADSFAYIAYAMASNAFSGTEDREAWARMLKYELSQYHQAVKDGFIWRRDVMYKPYEPSIADSAYEVRCRLLHVPFVTIQQSSRETGQGVELDFRLPETNSKLTYFNEIGLQELLSFMEQEKQVCSKSKGYAWLFGGCDVEVRHTPRSRIPVLLKEFHKIASSHTTTSVREHNAAQEKLFPYHES